MIDNRAQNSPDFITSNVKTQQDELQVLRWVQGGFPDCKNLLIRRLNESFEAFTSRQQMPLMFDAVSPFIRDVVGRILKDDPQLEGTSPQFKQLQNNVDNRGTGLVPFLNHVFSDACWAGHSLVLVDHTISQGALNLKDELDQGARPYWVNIKKDQICNFVPAVIDGVIRLGQITIAELSEQRDGLFGSKQVPQWRVLKRTPEGATWEIWQKNEKGEAIVVTAPTPFLGAGGVPLTDIPLVPFYARHTGFFSSRPLPIELARIVQADYNLSSDMEHNHFMSAYPVLVGIGVQQDELKKQQQGGGTGIMLPDINQKLEYIAGPGTGADMALRLSEKYRRQMVVAGNRLFETDQPDRETATAKGLDNEIDIALCLQIANSFQDSLSTVLAITQRYIDDKDGGKIILSPNQRQTAISTDPNAPPVPNPNTPFQRIPSLNTTEGAI